MKFPTLRFPEAGCFITSWLEEQTMHIIRRFSMETALKTTIQQSRPELVLPVRKNRSVGLAYFGDEYPSEAEKAYWILREKIITLEFPPGSAIRDADLTVKLGIGRTPIREALKRLEVEMFVVSHHRKGTYVNEITLVDFSRQYQIRRQLVTLAVALASQSREDTISQLENKSQYLAANAQKYTLQTIIQSMVDLELEIARASGNPFLSLTLQQYCGYARRTFHLLGSVLSVDDLQLEDYSKIMAWAAKKESERSSQLMALHVDQVHLTTVDRFLEKFI